MKGVSFPEQTTVFGKPEGWKDEDCYGLPVAQTYYRNSEGQPIPCLVSCWELTPEDIVELQKTGRIYLSITGTGLPPVSLSALYPFTQGCSKEEALAVHHRFRPIVEQEDHS